MTLNSGSGLAVGKSPTATARRFGQPRQLWCAVVPSAKNRQRQIRKTDSYYEEEPTTPELEIPTMEAGGEADKISRCSKPSHIERKARAVAGEWYVYKALEVVDGLAAESTNNCKSPANTLHGLFLLLAEERAETLCNAVFSSKKGRLQDGRCPEKSRFQSTQSAYRRQTPRREPRPPPSSSHRNPSWRRPETG